MSKRMILTLDFETFYSDEYSLKKMSTQEYVRDPRFLVQGVGLSVNFGPPRWLTGEQINAALGAVPWERTAMIGHNCPFDGLILSHHYGHVPKLYVDTLGMARAVVNRKNRYHGLDYIGEYYGVGNKLKGGAALANVKGVRLPDDETLAQLGEYCKQDVQLTNDIYRAMRGSFPAGEYQVLDTTVRMHTQPKLLLDPAVLEAAHAAEVERKDEVLRQLPYTKTQLRSGPQFAALLEELGVEPPTKISFSTKKKSYAFSKTDDGFIALQGHPDERVRQAVEARLVVNSSINETRAKSYLDIGNMGHPFCIPLNYAGALNTCRWSGGDGLNVQNWTRGGDIRRSVMAPPGHKLVVVDLSQIELRTCSVMAGQWDLVEDIRRNDQGLDKDPYCKLGDKIYGREIIKGRDHTERQVSKVGALSGQYGTGAKTFRTMVFVQGGVTMSPEECLNFIKSYRASVPAITRFWDNLNYMFAAIAGMGEYQFENAPFLSVVQGEGVRMPSGLMMYYPNLRRDIIEKTVEVEGEVITREVEAWVLDDGRRGTQSIWGGACTENLSQMTAREVMVYHLGLLLRENLVPVHTVHDEWIFCVPDDEAEDVLKRVTEIMSLSPDWWPELPVACEGSVAQRYVDAK